MSKRLQVLLEESELRETQRIARRHHMTVAEWVRQAIRGANRLESSANPASRIATIRVAAKHSFPTADIDQMVREIEQGYLGSREE